MTISPEDISGLRDHWAVRAIDEKDRKRAERIVAERLARDAVGEQISFSFKSTKTDEPLLERVAISYEIAAVEGLDVLSSSNGGDNDARKRATAASHYAFDIRRLSGIPEGTEERIFHTLQLSAVA